MTLDANALLTFLIYTRQTQQSAQPFRQCVSGEFDMTPLVRNQGIIVNAIHFYSRLGIIFDIFVKKLMLPMIYLATIAKYCKLLIRDVTNTLLKRSVGSRWWSVHPHGHYHHGSDNRMHKGARWMVGLCWVRWQIKIKIINSLF